MARRINPAVSSLFLTSIVLLAYAPMMRAAVITATYVNVQTSDNVTFNAAGYVQNYGNNFNSMAYLPVGKYFRFGIAISVTNNPNPAYELWEGTPTPQPRNLGAAGMAMVVYSSDPTGSNLATVQGTPRYDGRNTSKLTFVGVSNWMFATDVGDVLGTAAGTANALGSGQVGQSFQIYTGNSTANYTSLGLLADPGSVWFNGLMFKVVGYGPALLSPSIYTAGINIWHCISVGDPGDPLDPEDDVPPEYSPDMFGTVSNDSAVNPPLPFIDPEPSTGVMLSLGLLGLISRRRRQG
jgi:hypothetical protein